MSLERYFVESVDPQDLEEHRTRRDVAERTWLAALRTLRPSYQGTHVPQDRIDALYTAFESARDAAYEVSVGWNSSVPIVSFTQPYRIV